MLSFRKRGLLLESLHYKKTSANTAICELEFEEELENAERIRKNTLRLEDILEIEVLEVV
jgi:hypothetical protein